MNKLFSKILAGLFLLFISNYSFAAGLFCSASYGGYCNYSGKISRVYVNRSNLLLIYTEGGMDLSQLANAGNKFSMVTTGAAVAVNMNKYPVFGKNIYSAALTAFMGGKSITLQCKDNHGGYLQADRIWINK